jgi:1-deoxyxylulose-5-phosphate synthase
MVPWSSLARGRLARGWDDATGRSGRDPFADMLYTEKDSDHAIIDAVREIAGARGVTRPRSRWAGSASSRPSRPRSWA